MKNMRWTISLVVSTLVTRPVSMTAQQETRPPNTTAGMNVVDSAQAKGTTVADSVRNVATKIARTAICKAFEDAAVATLKETNSAQQARQAGTEAGQQALAALPDSTRQALGKQTFTCSATATPTTMPPATCARITRFANHWIADRVEAAERERKAAALVDSITQAARKNGGEINLDLDSILPDSLRALAPAVGGRCSIDLDPAILGKLYRAANNEKRHPQPTSAP